MAECFNCGISEEKVRLYDALGSKGIVKICSQCISHVDIPILKKPTTTQLKQSESVRKEVKQTVKPHGEVYERLTKMAGLDKKDYDPERQALELAKKQEDVGLKDIVDKNYKQRLEEKQKKQISELPELSPKDDLLSNFHWIIMRARRAKKLTQEQLGKEIAESEAAIRMAEQGILPEDDYKLINKLESFLGIKIKKTETSKTQIQAEDLELEEQKTYPARILSFDPMAAKSLTISDLQELKKKQEEKQEEKTGKSEDIEEQKKEEKEKKQEKIEDNEDDLIWKKE